MKPSLYPTPNDYTKPINAHYNINGYRAFLDRDHPLSSNTGTCYEHRHVASVTLGRWVTADEIVHHIDHDRANNDPSNLAITNTRGHAILHQRDSDRRTLTCSYCSKSFSIVQSQTDRRKHCSSECQHAAVKKFVIDPRTLRRLVWEKPLRAIAADFGVSDVTVAKRCKKLGIERPSQGHWVKPAP